MKVKCLGADQAFRRRQGEWRSWGVCVAGMEGGVEATGSAGQVSGGILFLFNMQGRCWNRGEAS